MDKDSEDQNSQKSIPLKVVDSSRELKKGVVASSLQELINRGMY